MSETRTVLRLDAEGNPAAHHVLNEEWAGHATGTLVTREWNGLAPLGPKGEIDSTAPVWVDPERFAQLEKDGLVTPVKPPKATESGEKGSSSPDREPGKGEGQGEGSPLVFDSARASSGRKGAR